MKIIVIAIPLAIGAFFLGAFFLMLIWGAIAGWFDFWTPTFKQACVLELALLTLGGAFGNWNSRSKSN